MKGTVLAVCRSREKGTAKEQIDEGELVADFGLRGDAHGGKWHRQVSLLGVESIDKMREKLNNDFQIKYGDFAENITTSGIKLHELKIGTILIIGDKIELEVTQIGKECHHGCEIFKQVGDCIMPREGIFARVLQGGTVKPGDDIRVDK